MNRSRSHELIERGSKVIPGGVNSPVRAFRGVGGDPVFFARGTGALVWDADGKHHREVAVAQQLLDQIDEIAKIFWATKQA